MWWAIHSTRIWVNLDNDALLTLASNAELTSATVVLAKLCTWVEKDLPSLVTLSPCKTLLYIWISKKLQYLSQIRILTLIPMLLFYLIQCLCVCKISGTDYIHSLHFHQKYQSQCRSEKVKLCVWCTILFLSGHLCMHYFWFVTMLATAEKRESHYQAPDVYWLLSGCICFCAL